MRFRRPGAAEEEAPATSFGAFTRGLRRWVISSWGRSTLWLVATMATSLVAAGWVLKIWDASLRVPLFLGNDGGTNLAAMKGLLGTGWYFSNPALGAPAGQDSIDPAGLTAENLPWLMLKGLSIVIHSPAVMMNAFYLLGFPLIAAVAFVVLRRFLVSRPSALVAGVLFSVLPYHFAKLQAGHVGLGMYIAVPAGCWLIMRALLGERFLQRNATKPSIRGWFTSANAGVVCACILVGGWTLYYAVFTLILLATAAVVRAAVERSPRGLLPAAGAFAGIGVVLVANLSPGLIYRMVHGANPGLFVRVPSESEA